MQRTFIITFLCVIFFVLQPAFEASAQQAARKKVNVLLINSYHSNLQWTHSIVNAVEDTLQAYDKSVKLYIEHLDTKHSFSETYLDSVRDIYAEKYKSISFSVVISSDDDAFNFCLKHQNDFLKGSPIVFCGVNFLDEEKLKGKNVTGVVESFDVGANFELISKLLPAVDKIYIINDKTTTGKANHVILEKNINEFKSRFKFEFIEDYKMEEVRKKVSSLDAKSAVFLMTFNRDLAGEIYDYEESISMIYEKSAAPIFSVWDFYLGGGLVGGMLINGRSQGEMAANMAVRILNGSAAKDLAIVKKSPNRHMFDYKMMEKYSIAESSLPKDSIIINQPFTFYSIDKNVFWFALIFLAVLTLVSIFLVINIFERRNAECELIRVNKKLENIINELENMVSTRTSELLNSNKSLQQEIEERRKVQDELRESEIKYRMLAENAYDVIFETDVTGRILYVSPNVREILGYSQLEYVSKNYLFMIHEDDADAVINMFNAIEAEGHASEVVFRGRRNDGADIWLESTGKIFKTAGGERHIVLVTRDISERHKIEEEIVKNAKLESLGLLAGGIAHDFNNVLMGIIGNISLAKKRLGSAGSVFELLERAEKVAHKARGLTEQLITFSKGGQPVKKILNIGDLIYEAGQFALAGAHIVSKFSISHDLWMVEADEGQLIQVITNMVINAKQACSQDGLIELIAENEYVDETQQLMDSGRYVKITIKDNGSGIAEENLKKIFDPYFTTRSDGRGIGLAAAYSIIKNHEGAICVDSKPNCGTAFFIFLPAA